MRPTNRFVRVGAYCIRPSVYLVDMIVRPLRGRLEGVCNTPLPIRIKNLIPLWTMNLKSGTCWGVCNTPLPIRIKNLIPIYWMNLKPGRFWGVCFCALPIRIKNLIPLWTMNLKLGGFWDVCLCDQPHPGEKPLKFVWMCAKPAGNWMNMAISTENPAGIGRKWLYSPKTRRELDENGHIYRKPGGDWTKMAISIENQVGIG